MQQMQPLAWQNPFSALAPQIPQQVPNLENHAPQQNNLELNGIPNLQEVLGGMGQMGSQPEIQQIL